MVTAITMLLLAQSSSQPVPFDPVTPAFVALGKYLGIGAPSVLLLWQFLRPLYEAWSSNVKRRLGDTETQLKDSTRAKVDALTEMQGRMAASLEFVSENMRTMSDTQRDLHRDMIEFRRETRATLDRIERDRE